MRTSVLVLLLAFVPAGLAGELPFEPSPIVTELVGSYYIVGHEPDEGRTYAGFAIIELHSLVGFQLSRWLQNGTAMTFTGSVESSAGEPVVVTRFRGVDRRPRTMTCYSPGDRERHLGLTCYWTYDADPAPGEPGIEALIPVKGWPLAKPPTGP